MTTRRGVAAAGLALLALVAQVSVLPLLSWHGIVPNLCLLVVVGFALLEGPSGGMVLGFATGLALDLAPPADHVAGRWALALVVVGYVAGRVRQEIPLTRPALLSTVAACSFLGGSLFALTGLVVGDLAVDVPAVLGVLLLGVLYDVLVSLLALLLLDRFVATPVPVSVAAR